MRISHLHVSSLVDAVQQLGLTEAELLEGTRFDRRHAQKVDAWLDMEDYEALLLWAIERTADPALGLHWGEKGTLVHYDIVTHLVCSAPTLRAAFDAIFQFHGLLAEELEIGLAEEGHTATLDCRLQGETPVCRRVRAELAVVGFTRVLKFFGGPEGAPHGVFFSYPPPAYHHEYERVFEQRPYFDHPFTGLSFDRALLDRRTLGADDDLHWALQAQARERLGRKMAASQHTARVLQHLRGAPSASPKMPDVARQLGMSCRSLRRRLSEEGATFPDLVAKVKASVAKSLLVDQRRSVDAVADEMGFSSASAFHRAFRRWTGETPQDFRREQTSRPRALTSNGASRLGQR